MEKLTKECDKHLERIKHASAKMAVFMPLDASRYAQLTDDEAAHIDQYLYRFSKLQDVIGEKLFVLHFLKEEYIKSKPFIDILNRLEQLDLLEDKNVWLELRKIRNTIAHQYEDEPEQASIALNAIYAARPTLETIYLALKSRYVSIK
ncbi:MAG: hypothetical protein PHO08_10055 [Methylococcales bacterium]|nr:hypothetical protein [Methylococcales bacterium]MDD5630678.1 hypothetical protein [Methylococcales bacterium]